MHRTAHTYAVLSQRGVTYSLLATAFFSLLQALVTRRTALCCHCGEATARMPGIRAPRPPWAVFASCAPVHTCTVYVWGGGAYGALVVASLMPAGSGRRAGLAL